MTQEFGPFESLISMFLIVCFKFFLELLILSNCNQQVNQYYFFAKAVFTVKASASKKSLKLIVKFSKDCLLNYAGR